MASIFYGTVVGDVIYDFFCDGSRYKSKVVRAILCALRVGWITLMYWENPVVVWKWIAWGDYRLGQPTAPTAIPEEEA